MGAKVVYWNSKITHLFIFAKNNFDLVSDLDSENVDGYYVVIVCYIVYYLLVLGVKKVGTVRSTEQSHVRVFLKLNLQPPT
jgi:hypothetical protein